MPVFNRGPEVMRVLIEAIEPYEAAYRSHVKAFDASWDAITRGESGRVDDLHPTGLDYVIADGELKEAADNLIRALWRCAASCVRRGDVLYVIQTNNLRMDKAAIEADSAERHPLPDPETADPNRPQVRPELGIRRIDLGPDAAYDLVVIPD